MLASSSQVTRQPLSFLNQMSNTMQIFTSAFSSSGRIVPRVGLLLSALCLFSGCGGSDLPAMGSVAGKVILGATTAMSRPGQINFESGDFGVSAFAFLNPDGSYSLEKELPVGNYKVYITPVGLGDTPPSEDGNPELNKPLEGVAPKYLSAATTDLVASISEGENAIDFDLQK